MAPKPDFDKIDGSLAFDGGVNSIKVSTIASERNPTGLARNELAWLVNATVRDGGITQRHGLIRACSIMKSAGKLFQGAFVYQPDNANPYFVASFSGSIYKIDPDTCEIINLSETAFIPSSAPAATQFGLVLKNTNTSFPIPQPPSGSVTPSSIAAGFPLPFTPAAPGVLAQAWSVPNLGNSSTAYMTVPYSGSVGDILTWHYVSGTAVANIAFQVTAFDLTPGASIGSTNPPFVPFAHFAQAENFLIIQAGDGVTLPLFWDGETLRRSKGITNVAATPGMPGVNEIPAGTTMDYYMGRLWYAQGRKYSAGDIVGGASGTIQYNFRDAVLNVTESPLVLGGDGFTVPANDGDIRCLKHGAAIDAALGQGRLFIFTRKAVYALQVPVSRNDWIATTNANQPLQTVVQLINGSVNDRSVVTNNGDLLYQSLEPAIRSLIQSVRYFNQWGNIDISSNEQRILQFNDRSVMRASSGIVFNNRMLQTALPEQRPEGIIHKALIPMDFVPISSFQSTKSPNWEGMYEGVNIMQMFTGDFGGRERAFAVVLSDADGEFQIWEITNSSRMDLSADNAIGNRVQWIVEFPAFTWGDEFMLKKLVGAEIWIDRLYGTVEFIAQFRPDGQACWNNWHQWKVCSPKNSCEDAINPICYPLTSYLESYRSTMWLPTPDPTRCASPSARPANVAFQFQVRLIIKGWCRVRGLMLHGEEVMQKLWDSLVC